MDAALHMSRAEVLTEPKRRRRLSDEEKAMILAVLSKPEASCAAIAQRFGVNRSLVYTWRKEAGLSMARRGAPAMPLSPVLLTGPAAPVSPPAPSADAARGTSAVRLSPSFQS